MDIYSVSCVSGSKPGVKLIMCESTCHSQNKHYYYLIKGAMFSNPKHICTSAHNAHQDKILYLSHYIIFHNGSIATKTNHLFIRKAVFSRLLCWSSTTKQLYLESLLKV